jgi:DNA-binding MarR family transcriptional regulator
VAQSPPVDNVGFLLAKASQWWNEQLTAALAAAGYPEVRASYGSVLLPLWEQDGLRMGALAERARLSKQTMTTLVRLVERDGLVERCTDPQDGRAVRVWLTSAGSTLGPVAATVVADLHAWVESVLGPRTVGSLRRSLSTIMNMTEARH